MSDALGAITRQLADLGAALPPWLVVMSAWTAVLVACAYGVDRLLARRVGARWRVLLYAPVWLRLALPANHPPRHNKLPRVGVDELEHLYSIRLEFHPGSPGRPCLKP